MKVLETLTKFEDHIFFKSLKESKEEKKEDKKELSPEKKEALKHQQEQEKELQTVFKKLDDNFNRFKTASGGKIERWKEFWGNQEVAKKALAAKGIKNFYKMFDSNFIICLYPHGTKAFLVILDPNDPDDKIVFKTDNKNAVKQLQGWLKKMIEEFKAVKQNHITTIEAKKKEEERAKAKEKLGRFLKESSYENIRLSKKPIRLTPEEKEGAVQVEDGELSNPSIFCNYAKLKDGRIIEIDMNGNMYEYEDVIEDKEYTNNSNPKMDNRRFVEITPEEAEGAIEIPIKGETFDVFYRLKDGRIIGVTPNDTYYLKKVINEID